MHAYIGLTILSVLFASTRDTNGVGCFSCQYGDPGDGTSDVSECVTSPESYVGALNPVDCGPNSRCLTYKQTYAVDEGIYFLMRGCAAPTDAEGCVSDLVYKTCKKVCDTEKCNGDNEVIEPKRGKAGSDKRKAKSGGDLKTGPTSATTTTSTTTTTTTPTTTPYTVCYDCIYNYNPDADDSCVTDPANVQTANTVNCPHDGRVCYIFREWDKGNNVIRSFRRGCDPATVEQGCVENFYYDSCYYYCNDRDLCNDMDGTLTTTTPKTTTIHTSGAETGPTLAPTTTTATTTTTSKPHTVCYSCTYNYNPGADDSCITNPANVQTANTVNCPDDENKFCTIFRQWDLGEQVIRSFSRGCLPVTVEQGCVEDTYFDSCYYYCDDRDLCNDMDGTVTTTTTKTTPKTTTIYTSGAGRMFYIAFWSNVLITSVIVV